MLDDHGGYHHAGGLGAGAGILVVELLAVLFFVHFPKEMIAQPHPAVRLVQSVERRPEGIDDQLLVTWLEFHLLVSFNAQRYAFFLLKNKEK